MVSWDQVPESAHTEIGLDHAKLEAGEDVGFWPVAQLRLVDEVWKDLDVDPTDVPDLLVCVYQALWNPPEAWCIWHKATMPDMPEPTRVPWVRQGVWALDSADDGLDDQTEELPGMVANLTLAPESSSILPPNVEELNRRFMRLFKEDSSLDGAAASATASSSSSMGPSQVCGSPPPGRGSASGGSARP